MEPEVPRSALRGVARRPAKGPLKNFLRDLRDLLRFQTLKATLQEFQRDDALGLAAQLAYYLILALFPFILFLIAVMDTFSSPEFVTELFDYLRRVMPAQVFGLIETYTVQTLRNEDTAPGLLSLGILGAIWAASGAFSALINALNRAYAVQETRPYWKVKGIALWVLASLAFNLYLSSDFNNYNKTYGSIGTVIVLLLYLYISSLTILFGATLNATLVRMKEEISGQQILDARPANEKPEILDDDAVEEMHNPDR